MMIGEHPETQVRCMYLYFNNISELYLKQLRLLEGRLSVIGTPLTSSSMNSVVTQIQLLSATVEQLYIDMITGIAQVGIENTSMKQTYVNIEGPNVKTVSIFGVHFTME